MWLVPRRQNTWRRARATGARDEAEQAMHACCSLLLMAAAGALLPFTALDAIDGSSGFGHVSGPRAERLAHDHQWKSQNLYSTIPTYVYCKN